MEESDPIFVIHATASTNMNATQHRTHICKAAARAVHGLYLDFLIPQWHRTAPSVQRRAIASGPGHAQDTSPHNSNSGSSPSAPMTEEEKAYLDSAVRCHPLLLYLLTS